MNKLLARLDELAVMRGAVATLLLVLAIYFGSGQLRHFDAALIAYTSATVFACFGIVYRYSVWLEKPSTRLYWRRGWQIFAQPSALPGNLIRLAGTVWSNVVAQFFISRRSMSRWIAHLLISWGCIVACAVTFPLVFGWVFFEPDPANPVGYHAYVFGIRTGAFAATSPIGWITFHVLDFCAIAILIGFAMAMTRRVHDSGAGSTQQFSMDFLPLIMLFTVCVTGLMLTASSLWMQGNSYSFISLLHAFSVIVTLLYMPFGKFFHVFQRPAQLGIEFYRRAGAAGPQACCASCGKPYASQMHVDDLKSVLDQLGLDQRLQGGIHYQEVCPPCRRRSLAVRQLEAIGGPGFL